jgi:hypothetical protein
LMKLITRRSLVQVIDRIRILFSSSFTNLSSLCEAYRPSTSLALGLV